MVRSGVTSRVAAIVWAAAIAFGALLAAAPARAASISVSPIRIDVLAPGNSGTVTLKNDSQQPVNVQIRIFAWSLNNGGDFYAASDDVVATPPVAAIAPGGAATVRIIRTSGAPVAREESYRLVVDEIPDANRQRNFGVAVALRYTLPVFFLDPSASQPKLTWSIRSEGGRRLLTAVNAGDKHIRVSALKLGGTVLERGLAGYVLGHSTRTWALPARASGNRVTAESDAGPVNAPLSR